MKQSEAVFTATVSVLAERGIQFNAGTDSIHSVLTKDITADIRGRVMAMFQADQVALKATESNASKIADSKKLAAYVSGLVTNWHNKDKRFNGGVQYVAKNPGSRQGQTDDTVKELRKLAAKPSVASNPESLAKVQAALEDRIAILAASKPAKAKAAKPLDISKLPEHLRNLA